MARMTWAITLLFIMAISFHYACGENDTLLERPIRSADFFGNLTAPVRRIFNRNPENESIITPVGEVPAYHLWKVHKYNGVQLKPISFGSIPYLEVPVSTNKPPKFVLPSLDELQVILGTNSNAETFDAIKEMASTREGLKLMADYIKANIGDTGVDITNMKKEDIDSMLSYYKYSVLSTETAKPISYRPPVAPAPSIESEHSTESIISRIHSYIKSKFTPAEIPSVQEYGITNNQPLVYNGVPNKFHNFNPFVQHVKSYALQRPIVHIVPQRFIQPVPIYIVPQIVYQQTTETPLSNENTEEKIEPMAILEDDSEGAAKSELDLPLLDIHTNFHVDKPVETYGPPAVEYGVPPSTSYGLVDHSNISPDQFNRFGHVIDGNPASNSVSGNDKIDIRAINENVPIRHSDNQFFKQSASIVVGPKAERTGIDTIIPFPVLPELPALPDAENFAYFQPPPHSESPGSFRFLPVNSLEQSSVFGNTISNPEPPKSSVFSFSSNTNEHFSEPDRNVITTKFEQPGFSYTQLSSLPLENGIQFKNTPGQVSSFGDNISSHIFQDDPFVAASENKIVVLKAKSENVKNNVPSSTTSSPSTTTQERQRWVPRKMRRPEYTFTNAPAARTEKIPVAKKMQNTNH